MDHFEDEHAHKIQFKEEEVEGTTKRRRGPSIPNWKEQPCSFDASGKCIRENSNAFSKHVAAEVRDCRNIPLVSDWRKIKEDRMEVFWNKIKEIAAKNKYNRRMKTMNHTTGAKSYARVRAELRKKHRKRADPVLFFRHCHTRKDSTWIDEISERTGANMEGNIQTMIESRQKDSDQLRTRVYVKMMGPERHNRVRGYGHGVTPDMVSYASSSASSSNSSKRSSKSSVAVLMIENNELRRKGEANAKQMADLEVKLDETRSQQQTQNQLLMLLLQKIQLPPRYSPGTQQSGQSRPHSLYPCPQGTQHSAQNQPLGAPVYPYIGCNQQPPSYLVYPTQPMAYMQHPPMVFMQQPPMSYVQQLPYQMPVYRPVMPSSDGICSDVPIGVFSGVLTSAPLDVDMARDFGLQGGSIKGSRSHSGSGSTD